MMNKRFSKLPDDGDPWAQSLTHMNIKEQPEIAMP